MSIGYIGAPSGSVIVPIQSFTKRTKEVTFTVTSAQAGWTTTRAVGIFYADSAGVWRLRFNCTGSFTSASVSSIIFTFSNITFKNTIYQAVTGIDNTTNSGWRVYANPSSSSMVMDRASAITITTIMLSSDIELDAEPTTYTTAANLENNVNVAAYFPNVIPGTSAGIVPAAGLPGNITGSAPAVGTIGEYIANVRSTASPNLSNNTVASIDSGNSTLNDNNETGITLTTGIWDIQGAVYFVGSGTTNSTNLQAFIGTAKGNSSTGQVLYANTTVIATALSTPLGYTISTPIWRVTLSVSATYYYLKSFISFSGGGTVSATGTLRATRVG